MIDTYFITVSPATYPDGGAIRGQIHLVYMDEDLASEGAVDGLVVGVLDVPDGEPHPRPGDWVTVGGAGVATGLDSGPSWGKHEN